MTATARKSFQEELSGLIDGPRRVVTMLITPEKARAMLGLNLNNRHIRKTHVLRLSNEMEQGRWRDGVDCIGFSNKGRLINGQHRLAAVLKSGRSIEADVKFGVEDDSFETIDQGTMRIPADVFGMHGVGNPALVAAATRLVYNYFIFGTVGSPDSAKRPSKAELYSFYLGHQMIGHSVSYGAAFYKTKMASGSLMAALHYLCSQVDPELAREFFPKVATGVGIESASEPACKLRNVLLENARGHERLTNEAVAAYTVKAWNAEREGRKTVHLRWRGEGARTEAFPKIM